MISVTVLHDIATITIDNRDTRNALDDATREALLVALKEITVDSKLVAIILTGENDTFCAGGELASMPTDEVHMRRRLGEMHDIVRLIHAGPKPVIAAVNGAAFGSGLSLAAACDYVVATSKSQFGCSFGKVGLLADTGLLWTLQGRVGQLAARHILLESRTIGTEEGLRIGLVDELAAANELLHRAESYASRFHDFAPLAVAATKRLLASSITGLDALLAAEMEAQVDLLSGDDFAEGRSAFFEKRRPSFGERFSIGES